MHYMTRPKKVVLNARLPPELKDALAKLATRNRRSVTGQIEFMIEEAVRSAERHPGGGGGDA